ncbi:MAG: hypothetical protein CME38_16215 [Haliea sp.]|nr:hypothetical protein [Haliea sp.]|tara:strand:+ start:1806 stop:2111 length:306 start_codon:yes stop_codon:yes gene_type:complete
MSNEMVAQIAGAVAAAEAHTRSKAARRVMRFLLTNPGAMTHEVARACAISNVSCAAGYARPALRYQGFDIVAELPDRPVVNRFGERSQVHEWWIRPLEGQP